MATPMVGTRRYFTDSWKTITDLCHNYRLVHRWIGTITDGYTNGLVPVGILPRVGKQLWTCATITDGYTNGLVPVSILPRVGKKLRTCAIITDGYIDGFTDEKRTSRSARLSEAWSVDTFTDGIASGTVSDGLANKSKSQAGFLKFLVRISIYYRRKLMLPTTINYPSVIPLEKLVYKTPPPLIWFIFSLGSRLSSLFLFSSLFEFCFWKRFYCFGGSFKHIKRFCFFFFWKKFLVRI